MKKITLLVLTFITIVTYSQNIKDGRTVFGKTISPENISPDGYIRCASNEYEDYLRLQNPKLESREKFEIWMANKIQEANAIQNVSSQSGGIIYIPVVVHVIHNGDAYGVNENITDEQVQSQITVMTQDYRRMAGTPGFNNNTVGADTQIEFVLAKVDPNGNPTNGIDRVNLCQASWSTTEINGTLKPATIWDPTLYMNMWSVNFTDSQLLGYAQFPSSSTLSGLNANGGAENTDGVVAGYRFFGSQSIYPAGNFSAPYNQGRTMTHEVGHFLGLRHIWGDNSTCPATNSDADKDYCADTPATSGSNFGCPAGTDRCAATPGVDMIQNYMDYTDDTCMNIFTNDQKTRITTVMNNSPRRSTLKTSTKDVAIPLFANDAEVKIENLCGAVEPTCDTPNPPAPAKVISLYNRGNTNMTSATLSYNMNGGTNQTQSWSGNLAPNKYALVTLTNSTVNGTLNVSVATVNGSADQRATNNTASRTFGTASGSLAYANATSFTFNLTGDRWGAEIDWTLKNQAGVTLFSGGPYTNTTVNGTQVLVANEVWTLPANGCYFLTINDSWGDGLFDGTAQGFYTVTAGATTVVNVPNFVASGNPDNTPISRISYFTNNAALSSEDFNALEDVSLFPNPSSEYFTIYLPQNILPSGKLEIFNNLGQQIALKQIATDNDLRINVSSYSNGVYFLNLTIGEQTKTLKFIKN
jgi:hypothetical protein